MKKWCIVDNCGTDEWIEAFNSKEKALEQAESEWNLLTEHDKNKRVSFIVGLCNVEEYKQGEWQYTELKDGNIDTNIYEIAKDFK